MKSHRSGKTYSIEEGTEDVHGSLKHDPSEAHAVIQLGERVEGQGMKDGNDSGCAETDEHHGAVRAPGGSAEMLKPRDGDASKTQETDLRIVSYIGLTSILQ